MAFKIGDTVTVIGYDSTGTFCHSFQGVVVDCDDLTCKVRLDRGYHSRVWIGQCKLIQKALDY